MRRLVLAFVLLATACAPPDDPPAPVILLELGPEDAVDETLVAGEWLVHVVARERGDRREVVVTGPAGEAPRIAGEHAEVRALPGGDVIGCTEGRLERLDAAGAFVPLFGACGEVVEVGERIAVLSGAAWLSPGTLAVRDPDGTERVLGDDIQIGVAAHEGELVALTGASTLVVIDPATGTRRTLASNAFAFELDAEGRLAWEGWDGRVWARTSLDDFDREVARLIPPSAGPPFDVFHLDGGWIYAVDDLQTLLVVASVDSGDELELPDHDALDAVAGGRFVLARYLGGQGGESRFEHAVWTPGAAPRVAFAELPYDTSVVAIEDGLVATTSSGLEPGPVWFAPWDGDGRVLVDDGPRFATAVGPGRLAVVTEHRVQAGAEDWPSSRAQLGRLRVIDLASGEVREIARDVRVHPEPQALAGGVVFDQVDEAAGTSARVLVSW